MLEKQFALFLRLFPFFSFLHTVSCKNRSEFDDVIPVVK